MAVAPRLVLVRRSTLIYGATSVVLMAVTAYLAARGISASEFGTRLDCGSVIRPSTSGTDLPCRTARAPREGYVAFAFALMIVTQVALWASLIVDMKVANLDSVGRLVEIRRVRPAEATAVAATLDEVVRSEMGWNPQHVGHLEDAVRSGRLTNMVVIVEPGSECVVGAISFEADPTTSLALHLGMWMGPNHRGQGLMTEALQLFVDRVVVDGSGLRAETSTTNIAAQRVLERAGLVAEGARRVRLPDDSVIDGVIYARYVDAAKATEFTLPQK